MTLTWVREGPNKYWRTAIALLPLYIWAEIVPVEGAEEDEAPFELHVIAEVRNVDSCDEQVGYDVSPLPDFTPDSDPNNDLALDALTLDLIEGLNMRVHSDVRRELENTEEDLKRLRAIERKMSRVTLIHESGKHITLTLDLARVVLALGDEKARRPWRIELEAPNLAACYDELNRLAGRIVFRPELNGQPGVPGRLGLYVYEEAGLKARKQK